MYFIIILLVMYCPSVSDGLEYLLTERNDDSVPFFTETVSLRHASMMDEQMAEKA